MKTTKAKYCVGQMIHEMKIGNSGESKIPELAPNAKKLVNIPDEALAGIKDEITENLDQTVRMFL